MSESIHLLAQQLLGKNTVSDCSLQEVQELVRRHPYFAPAQFLLLEKLREEEDPAYEAQLQKAVLYYHNPVAFEYFMHSDRFYTDDVLQEEAISDFTPPTPETQGVEEEPTGNEHGAATETDEPQEESIMEWEEDPVELHESATYPEQLSADENSVVPEETESHAVEETAVEHPAPAATEVPQAATVFPPKQETQAEPLAFEPFHTVDYFASQGIKLSLDEAPKDALGKQLKSFTEWLKTMKRLPATELSKNVTASTEQKVVNLAESSVHEADVVTEAMAEVWLKQGNRQKALEVYNKLSLQNPSKNAYFAAIIENLKRS